MVINSHDGSILEKNTAEAYKTARCAALTATLGWSGRAEHPAWRRVTLLCKWSRAELMAGERGRRQGHKRMSSGVYF